jgi:DNA-binding response OmpR family regulator
MARILVVDDEPNIRLIYATALRDSGHDVVEAASGQEALATVAKQTFDLVVLDIKLGAESGLTVLQQVVAVSPGTPVILLTAYTSFQDDFVSWLADRYVVKSADLDLFLGEVEQVLHHRAVPAPEREGLRRHLHP